MATSLATQLSQMTVSGGGGGSEAVIAQRQLDNLLGGDTANYIKEGRVMVLLRGVSGAGKSTIVEQLKDVLSTKAVCSADDFFFSGGTYNFDPSKLKYAHEWCHRKAEKYCQDGEPVVIIDNTHVKAWETHFYSNLARSTGYVFIAITAPGQYTTSPRTLARRNKHGVDLDTIQQKLKMFEVITPLFYGWFFNSVMTEKLRELGKRARDNFQSSSSLKSVIPAFELEKQDLHVTSCFLGRGASPDSQARARRRLAEHVGSVDRIELVAIIATKQTLSIKVKLGESAMRYYMNDEDDGRSRGRASLPTGFAAHITLSCVDGVSAATAKSDAILAGLCQLNQEKCVKAGSSVFYTEKQVVVQQLRQGLFAPAVFSQY